MFDFLRSRSALIAAFTTFFVVLFWEQQRRNAYSVANGSYTIEIKSKPPPSPLQPQHSRTLVVARKKDENVDWIEEQLQNEPRLTLAVYTVDDNTTAAAYSVPANRGHEAMPYLTHIINYYDELDDVTIFMHSHRFAWHNNDLMEDDAVLMVKKLRTEKAVDKGYMNLRCHQSPGCPSYISPTLDPTPSISAVDALNTPEAQIIGQAWTALFPDVALPSTLSQPCCGQFAASKSAIRARPRGDYVFFRDWLLTTDLEDKLSGRVFEYVYQYIFGNTFEYCPEISSCYCEGFGICFEGGEAGYWEYTNLKEWRAQLIDEIVTGEIENTITEDQVMGLEGEILNVETDMAKKWNLATASSSQDRDDERESSKAS
ncbi:MAG: hypothetical protein Q9227_008693 [Pyrenula ochraceoflavens]